MRNAKFVFSLDPHPCSIHPALSSFPPLSTKHTHTHTQYELWTGERAYSGGRENAYEPPGAVPTLLPPCLAETYDGCLEAAPEHRLPIETVQLNLLEETRAHMMGDTAEFLFREASSFGCV